MEYIYLIYLARNTYEEKKRDYTENNENILKITMIF